MDGRPKGYWVGLSLFVLTLIGQPLSAWAKDPFSVILVDKHKNELHLGAYTGDRIEIKKTYHATLGRALGDKEVEKDLKTPEGIYFFTTLLKPFLKALYLISIWNE